MATQLNIFTATNNGVLTVEGGRFLVDTSVAPVNIYIPHGSSPGLSFFIYDWTGNAATNPITIRSVVGSLINGAATLVLNTNRASVEIFSDGAGGFIATSTSGGSGGGSSTTVGSGAPVAAGTSGEFYWDETNKLLYVYDVDGWNIH